MRAPIFALLLLLLVSLACVLPGFGQKDEKPVEQIPVSEEAAQRAETKFQDVVQQANDATIELSFTEEELTSLLVYRLSSDLPIENEAIFLRDGLIRIEATMTIQGISQPAVVIIRPSVENGTLQLTIEEAKVGPLPIPQPILDEITTQLTTLLTNMENISVEDVQVADGVLTLTLSK